MRIILMAILLFLTNSVAVAEETEMEYLTKYSMLLLPYKRVMQEFGSEIQLETTCRYCGEEDLADTIRVGRNTLRENIINSVNQYELLNSEDKTRNRYEILDSVFRDESQKIWMVRSVEAMVQTYMGGYGTGLATLLDGNPEYKRQVCMQTIKLVKQKVGK